MRFAITGSTGMIGATLAKVASEEGHEVIAIVRPGSKKRKNIPESDKIEMIECDISDYKTLKNKNECDIFFHFAWDGTYGESRDDVRLQFNNVEYTIDAVELAKSWNASAFIGAGSQAEYGPLDKMAYIDTPTNPKSGYGIAKYSAGKMAILRCRQAGIRSCWGRIFSSYGDLDAEHTLTKYLIYAILNKQRPDLTKCEQMWDYIYSEDVAHAFMAIGLRGIDGRTYNIGGGECRQLKEYVSMVRDAIDPDAELNFGAKEYFPDQPMFLCADIGQLTADTGFVPKYDFKEGISRTISFVKDQLNSSSRSD